MNTQRLLLLGAPRSGTTMLFSMIGHHPEVGMMAEGFYQEEDKIVGKRVVANKLCVPNQIELDLPFVSGSRRLPFWIGTCFYKVGLRLLMRSMPTPLWRPSPNRYQSITDFLNLENGRIISILRNPDAVIHSIMQRGGKSLNEALRRWRRSVEITDEIQRRHSSRIHVVHFNSLVVETESALRRCCRFLNLDYDEAMPKGIKYNPMGSDYQNEKIDSSRAQKNTPDYNIQDKCSSTYATYKNICSQTEPPQ